MSMLLRCSICAAMTKENMTQKINQDIFKLCFKIANSLKIPLLAMDEQQKVFQTSSDVTAANLQFISQVPDSLWKILWKADLQAERLYHLSYVLIPFRLENIVLLYLLSTKEHFAPNDKFLSLEEIQRAHIIKALQQTNGRVSGEKGAAILLDVNAKTLFSKMRKLDIAARNISKIDYQKGNPE